MNLIKILEVLVGDSFFFWFPDETVYKHSRGDTKAYKTEYCQEGGDIPRPTE